MLGMSLRCGVIVAVAVSPAPIDRCIAFPGVEGLAALNAEGNKVPEAVLACIGLTALPAETTRKAAGLL